MSSPKPSDLEAMRAVRYLRHHETCAVCTAYNRPFCLTAQRHYMLWAETWDKEVYTPRERAREDSRRKVR